MLSLAAVGCLFGHYPIQNASCVSAGLAHAKKNEDDGDDDEDENHTTEQAFKATAKDLGRGQARCRAWLTSFRFSLQFL